MNPHDELDLLRRLRQLPREREPQRDLWTGIAARIDAQPVLASRTPRRWMAAGFALAATLAVVAVMATRQPSAPVAPAVVSQPAKNPGAQLVRLQADALALEYTVALEAFEGAPLPREFRAAAVELDDSARRIRSALRQEPDAVYLLERLRHTYDQRLKLSQRALVG
jgi:hypothetical protein